MKAIVCTKYGPPDVLKLKEIVKPTPKDNEVLIKIHATTVTPMDWKFRSGKIFLARLLSGIIRPKNPILGTELSGVIENVGKKVKQFKKGDKIFAGTKGGAHAEYICLSEEEIVTKPTNMTFEEAAAVPFGACTALYFLKNKGNIQSSQKILINGASGGVGAFAVQLAKYFGAEITGVCSTKNLKLVQSPGADYVIDYTKEDFTKNGKSYDIIFDAVGKNTFLNCKNSLNQKGIYLSTIATFSLIIQMLWTSIIGGKKAKSAVTKLHTEDLVFLKKIIESEKLKTVIDKRYNLNQMVEAHKYSEKEHASGKIIITI